jgi:SRSO17 transposase
MIIDRCPKSLQGFLKSQKTRLSKPQGRRLWMMLVGWVFSARVGKILHVARLAFQGHRTSFAGFMTRSQWDAEKLLHDAALREIRRLRPRHGEVLELLIDDTRNAKRGRQMAALSKIWDHAAQRFAHGHIIVTAAIRFRGIVLPWQFDLWLPQSYTGKKAYRKVTERAAELIRSFPGIEGLRVRVLFDAFYLCPTVTQACAARGWKWFSVAARNRNFTPNGRRRRKLIDWVKGFLQHNGQRVRLRRSRGWAWMRIAAADGHLARIGTVRLVVSKRPKDVWKNLVVFATNATNLKARAIVAIYEHRWDIETLFKELKGTLGLGAYQVLTENGIRHHLHLCGLTHVWLTRHSLDAVDAKARKASKELSLPPLAQRLESLREQLRNERLHRLLQRTRHPGLRRKLTKYLREVLPPTGAAA